VNAELQARVESLEAERLRPVPPAPPRLPAAVSEALRLVMDRLVELDENGALGDDEPKGAAR
jgi:hypothetical protein